MDGLIAYALSKKYVDGKTSGLATGMSWKGTKENINSLPQSGNKIGDLWHVNENGNEYAWDGSKWEALGGLDKSFTETDPTVPDWAKQREKPSYTATEVGALPSSTFIPSKVSDLQNDSGYLTSVPVQSVNDKTGAVILNASDVGALPATTPIPAAVTEQTVAEWGFTKNTGMYNKPSDGIPKSDLSQAVQTSLNKADTALQQHQSLSAYRTASVQDTIDAAQDTAIAAKYTKPSMGIPKSDLAAAVQASLDKADTALQSHQSLSGYATEQWVESKSYLTQHQDISGKADASDVAALVSRLNAITDSDDTTLDQLSEIVAYIKNNKSLIDNITTGKVSVSDIVDNLTSSATNKPLSANQGRALKALIDAIVVPTESTVSGWGFTKNTGTYSKPSGGIPKSDLASDVQASLGKADTALQQHQSLSGYATQSWVEGKGYLTLNDLPIYSGGVT